MLLCTLPVYIVILFINEIITYQKKIYPLQSLLTLPSLILLFLSIHMWYTVAQHATLHREALKLLPLRFLIPQMINNSQSFGTLGTKHKAMIISRFCWWRGIWRTNDLCLLICVCRIDKQDLFQNPIVIICPW